MADADAAGLNLDGYDTREGLWNPDHGSVELPEGWEFLPAGDAFVTRQVKSAGVYWTAWRPRGRNRPHRRKLGLFAPTAAITRARGEAEQTSARRLSRRVHEFTDYDDRLAELDPLEAEIDDFEYRSIKHAAHDAVDDFLDAHRPPPDSK